VLSGLVARIQRRSRRAGLSTLSELADARSFLVEAAG